jgi:hypothetical protein
MVFTKCLIIWIRSIFTFSYIHLDIPVLMLPVCWGGEYWIQYSDVILVSPTLRMGSKGYPETSYLSYNIKPRYSPKELQLQFHRDESLRSPECFSLTFRVAFIHNKILFTIKFYLQQSFAHSAALNHLPHFSTCSREPSWVSMAGHL